MKKRIHTAKLKTPVVQSHRSFRRFAKKLFTSLIKRQNQNLQKSLMRELQDIKEMLEIMAREMARQAKRGE
jgi:hypothetical protein